MTQYGSTTNGIILEWKLFHLHFNGILDLVKVEVDRFVGKTKSTWIQTIITITITNNNNNTNDNNDNKNNAMILY